MMPLGEGPLKGISTQHLSKGITFYVNESPVKPVVSGQTKPLLLMLPWLGSRPQAQLKYCEIYLRTGFDVLMVESNTGHFLWPRWGLEYSAQVLRLLESERFSQRPIVVHAFSIGGYTFAQLLMNITRDTRRYRGLIDRVRGQIYDSLVIGSLERMAIGVSKNLVPYFESLVKHTSLLYFRVFKRQTVDYFNASVDVFMNTPVTCPALYYFCGNDVLSDPEALQNLLEHWRKRGISVTSKKWEESEHAGHLRIHPQEYRAVLEHFLCSLNMAPLKAKM
ncbi:transmembrane protein 53-A-like isoform X2 [Neoarius graeffei]|nr:transmembrane protein 53-A-like isoform X2 [Neoarius graeffei]XP_060779602.1 transmembrane protein 53-A-like isoform X2 [Neoarius graeffei]XP_060779603.1 transmembrane protein 53-A-like isoform X2 [Neoarius graeffei]XP_060779604.1 transmembrane protein 53-A-like isoform X2 [Neoarius graeffei]